MLLTKNIFLLLGLYIILAYQANANSQVWHGNILTTEEVPKTAFILSDIYYGADSDFKAIIVNQEIKTVVLISNGGYVNTGMHISDLIFKSKIATYKPGKINGKTAKCISACTFIFFAGKPRLAEGTVAVHRFATDFEAFLKAEFEENDLEEIVDLISRNQQNDQALTSHLISKFRDYNVPSEIIELTFETDAETVTFLDQNLTRKLNSRNLIDDKKLDQINAYLKNYICLTDSGYIQGVRQTPLGDCLPLKKQENLNRDGEINEVIKTVTLEINFCSNSIDEMFMKKYFPAISLNFTAKRGLTITQKENIEKSAKIHEPVKLSQVSKSSYTGAQRLTIKNNSLRANFELLKDSGDKSFWLSIDTDDQQNLCNYSLLTEK